MRDLEFIGAMIDGHSNGPYLKHPGKQYLALQYLALQYLAL